MRGLLISSLLLVTSTAAADDGMDRASLGEGYDLVMERGNAYVAKGKQRARLVDGVAIKKVTVDKASKKVTAKLEDYSCAGEHEYTWTYGHLQARLDNTSAYALHKKKDYKGSSAGFAKAVAADPTWKIPAVNLASAQQLLGDKDAAIKTLTPWLTSEPIATYVQATTDAELAPLLDRPELKALRAAKAGDVKVTTDGIDGVAYDASRKLIAVSRTEGGWGACFFETQIEIYDATSGKLLAATPVIRTDETSPDCGDDTSGSILPKAKKTIAKRTTTLQKMLRDLGFKKGNVESTSLEWDDAGAKRKGSLKKAKLGVVAADGTVRVFQGNTELGSGSTLDNASQAMYVKDIDSVVVWSGRPGAEGCEGTDPTAVTIIALKRTAAPAKTK